MLLREAALDVSRFIYCFFSGCSNNADLVLSFGQSNAAWGDHAAIIDTGEKRSEGSYYGFLGSGDRSTVVIHHMSMAKGAYRKTHVQR